MRYFFTRGLLAGLLLLTLPGTAVKAQSIPRAEAGNNLQVGMSLLNPQADSLRAGAALSAVQDQHRVQAMALIHRKRYPPEGVARIPMAGYTEEGVSCLSDSCNLSRPIAFHLSVDDTEPDVTQAVPPRLITNQAITNAFRYAFPGGRAGNGNHTLQRRAEAYA